MHVVVHVVVLIVVFVAFSAYESVFFSIDSCACMLVCLRVLLLCRMGKIAVTAACGLIAFGLSDIKYYTDPVNHPDTYLSSPLMPVLVSVLAGYTISNLFLQVKPSYVA